MKWIETLIIYLFPTILLDGKPWRNMWEEKERETFAIICRVLFSFAIIGYVGHYFFYDKPMGLEPIERWFAFRMIAATVSLLALTFYLSPLKNSRFYKVPAIVTTWVFCYTQAMIINWWDGTPWLYSFIFDAGSVIVIRTSPLNSVVLASIFITTQTPALITHGVPMSSVVSSAVLVSIVLAVIRTSYISDIRNFMLNQENVAAQKQIIELNIEFADRLRAFIPRVIAKRMEDHVNEHRLGFIQAAIEVLKPRQTKVACLFSDIRGFTQGSKELDSFVSNSVLPEMKACSDLVEDFEGIPRKVGDLIFAYFDSTDVKVNTIRAVLAGMGISRLNTDMNATVTDAEIRRYILISVGDAIVGNLGGLDSSIEITALGSPVNFLSRLDDLTKDQNIAALLEPGDIIACDDTIAILRDLDADVQSDTIDLRALDLTVRDFPETQTVNRIKASDTNYQELRNTYLRVVTRDNGSALRYDNIVSGQV
jgi:class 3 adenylate cyclase